MNVLNERNDDPSDYDNELLSDFDDWLERELPRVQPGIDWIDRDDTPDPDPRADWIAAAAGLRYAIVIALANQLPAALARLQRLAQAEPLGPIVVLASPDRLPDDLATVLPNGTLIWDAHWWWYSSWGRIRASPRTLTIAHLHQQVALWLLTRLAALPPGPNGGAPAQYHALAMTMVRFLYGHQLRFPRREVSTGDRAQRRDGLFDNHAQDGPWHWLVQHGYHAPSITLEAKNVTGPIGGPEIDQLAGYLGRSRPGSVGILACRQRPVPGSPAARHLPTLAHDGRLILPFDDARFTTMIQARAAGDSDAVDAVVYEVIREVRDPL